MSQGQKKTESGVGSLASRHLPHVIALGVLIVIVGLALDSEILLIVIKDN